jgi:Leucine-rich repeat (LRR) protein
MANLEELWLYDNALTSLPKAIGRLGRLQRLWLDRNRLESLPPEIGGCARLQARRAAARPRGQGWRRGARGWPWWGRARHAAWLRAAARQAGGTPEADSTPQHPE